MTDTQLAPHTEPSALTPPARQPPTWVLLVCLGTALILVLVLAWAVPRAGEAREAKARAGSLVDDLDLVVADRDEEVERIDGIDERRRAVDQEIRSLRADIDAGDEEIHDLEEAVADQIDRIAAEAAAAAAAAADAAEAAAADAAEAAGASSLPTATPPSWEPSCYGSNC